MKRRGPPRKPANQRYVKTSITLAPQLHRFAERESGRAEYGSLSCFIGALLQDEWKRRRRK